MSYKLFVCLCVSFVFIGGVFGQTGTTTSSNVKYYLFENDAWMEMFGPRPKNKVVVAEDHAPIQFPPFFGEYFEETNELLLYWDTDKIIEHIEFSSIFLQARIFKLPIHSTGNNNTRVVLKLDTDVLLPDDNYNIRLVTVNGQTFSSRLGFNKDTIE